MHIIRRYRLLGVMLILIFSAMAAYLVILALAENTSFFRTPTELIQQGAVDQVTLGGVVQKGSVKEQGLSTEFIVTDFKQNVVVVYKGIMPDLFREGQGIVVKGSFNGSRLQANIVLAKHDENYVPYSLKNKNNRSQLPSQQ